MGVGRAQRRHCKVLLVSLKEVVANHQMALSGPGYCLSGPGTAEILSGGGRNTEEIDASRCLKNKESLSISLAVSWMLLGFHG